MSITAGQTAEATDFITVSERNATPSVDSGRVVQLESDGTQHQDFQRNIPAVQAVCAEAITLLDAVSIQLDAKTRIKTYGVLSGNDTLALDNAITNWYAQIFTSPVYKYRLTGVMLHFRRPAAITSGGANTLTVRIYAVDGSNKPTGAALATGTLDTGFTNTIIGSTTTGSALARITFASSVNLDASTNYAIVLSYVATDTDDFIIRGNSGNSTNYVANWESNDSGATWTTWSISGSHRPAFALMGGLVLGQAYRCRASEPDLISNFFGWASIESGTAGQTKSFQEHANSGEALNTGLTSGSAYYLSDTAGAVSTSAGTYSKLVGVARSTTRLVLNQKKTKTIVTSTIPVLTDMQFTTTAPVPFDYEWLASTAPVASGYQINIYRYAIDSSIIFAIQNNGASGDNQTITQQAKLEQGDYAITTSTDGTTTTRQYSYEL